MLRRRRGLDRGVGKVGCCIEAKAESIEKLRRYGGGAVREASFYFGGKERGFGGRGGIGW